MPVTAQQKFVAKAVKDYMIGLGIARSDASVTSSGGLSTYIQARIRPLKKEDFRAPLEWSASFPLDDRIAMLKVIYPNTPSCWSGSAGNIGSYSCTMRAEEWSTFLASLNNNK